MNDKIWKIIIPLTIALISVFVGSYGWKLCEENHWEVPGTVIGKSETAVSHRHSRSISSEWWFAVKPDNSKYKAYDVCVDYAIFSTYKIGDHVSFKVMSNKVDPNGHDDTIAIILFVLSIGGCIYAFSSLFSTIFCDECD
jgi:hypothetical protein